MGDSPHRLSGNDGVETDYGDAAERRSSFALRATEDKYDRGDQATRWSDGRWRLKSAAVWYDFNISVRSEDEKT